MKNSNNTLGIIIWGLLLPFISISQNGNSLPAKVSHIEPLYIDLARDLGARKGEKEINIGADFSSVKNQKKYLLLAEYEWAPINRLGLEIEADLSLFNSNRTATSTFKNKIESLKLSAQYTFLVLPELKLSMAGGYTQLFELPDFQSMSKENYLSELTYNPFIVAAKRWGNKFHSLIYISSLIKQNYSNPQHIHYNWQISSSVHYSQGKYNIGLEVNSYLTEETLQFTIRPQMKIHLSNQLAVGFVLGIPTNNKEEFSSFIRFIYEL